MGVGDVSVERIWTEDCSPVPVLGREWIQVDWVGLSSKRRPRVERCFSPYNAFVAQCSSACSFTRELVCFMNSLLWILRMRSCRCCFVLRFTFNTAEPKTCRYPGQATPAWVLPGYVPYPGYRVRMAHILAIPRRGLTRINLRFCSASSAERFQTVYMYNSFPSSLVFDVNVSR